MRSDDFLRRVARYTAAQIEIPPAVRLATIDPAYVASSYPGTLPRVTFDDDDTLTTKGYAVAGPYLPSPGDRVMMIPAGTTYAIVGSVGGTGRVQPDGGVRYTFVESATLLSGIANTAPAAAVSPNGLATTFTAPPSGAVEIAVAGVVRSGSLTFATYLGYEVRLGTVLGTQFLAADVSRSVLAGRSVQTSAPAEASASNVRPLSGLTPGSTYFVQAMQWVSGGSGGSIDYRSLYVKPLP